MKTTIRLQNGKRLELEGKLLKERTVFGRKEGLFQGKMTEPTWVRIDKVWDSTSPELKKD